MTLGSLLHVLFQSAIANGKRSRTELAALLADLLKKRSTIGQLYEAEVSEETVVRETLVYLQSIETWLLTNNNNNSSSSPLATSKKTNRGGGQTTTEPSCFQILGVEDIEESIWSPKYGIKGKVDLTLRVTRINMSVHHKNLVSSSSCSLKSAAVTEEEEEHVIPVELKSGKSTFSVEHEGQLMLYALLNSEKRSGGDDAKTTTTTRKNKSSTQDDFGLLLYLKDMQTRFVKVNATSLRGLVQLRNELAFYYTSSESELPDFRFYLKLILFFFFFFS
jgi:DNA replication ATP-dependent helicase Dna2